MTVNSVKNNFNSFLNAASFVAHKIPYVNKIFETATKAFASIGALFRKQKVENNERISSQTANSQQVKVPKKYSDLPRNEMHQKALETIMKGMSSGGYFWIFRRAKSLYQAKSIILFKIVDGKIHGVHPLKQLGYVISRGDLSQMLSIIMNYQGKLAAVKSGYLKNMAETLEMANKNNLIIPFMPDYVKEISGDLSSSQRSALVKKLVNIAKKDDQDKWQAFILASLNNK